MSFILNEPNTFINIKLSDDGRRALSLGRLNFASAILGDSEVNYGIDRTGYYSISNNRILAPKDAQPKPQSMDGSTPITLGPSRISSLRQIITSSTVSTGVISGTSNNFAIDPQKYYTKLTISYTGSGIPSGTNIIGYDAGSATPNDPQSGNLIYIPWESIQASSSTYSSSSIISSGNPTVGLWYRVISADTNNELLTLDRAVPNFGVSTSQKINAYVYPYNAIETYYGSAATVSCGVWNLNIVRTSSELGLNNTISGYSTYSSIEFNGTKHYLGFSSDTRAVGIIHFTNNYTGNTYAEQLVEKTVEINLPTILYHRTNQNNGQAVTYGLTLTDVAGDTIFDYSANTSYRYLRDGSSTSNTILGRVYHKLKIAVITDPELLTAMTYKSNRNYTLPPLQLSLSNAPKYPLSNSDATGSCTSGKTYYCTYSVSGNSPYTSGVTYGYPTVLPCSAISRIKGELDINGNPTFLTASFPSNSFPYLRSSTNMNVMYGSGFNFNKVQILMNEVDDDDLLDFDTIPSDSWTAVSTTYGNGLYSGDTTDLTIDPLKLNSQTFVISSEDIASGSTYVMDSAFYSNDNVNLSGLTFGSESFLFGTFKSNIMATSFKTSIVVAADSSSFNSSLNTSFDPDIDTGTFITEICILDDLGSPVATGKPTYPINKSNARFLAFKLELDF